MASTKQVSQETLNNYPNIVDITFGYENPTYYSYINQKFSVSSAFTLDNVYIYLNSIDNPANIVFYVYTDEAGPPSAPGTQVATGGSVVSSTGWSTLTVSSSDELSAGDYWLQILIVTTGSKVIGTIGSDSGNSYGDTLHYSFSGDWETASYDLAFQLWGELAAAPPTKATNPTPTDSSTVKVQTIQLSWEDGGGAETYNVYFGTTGNLTLQSSAQIGTTWTLPALSYGTEYQWRIDSTNGEGTTTGDVWTFTTESFSYPLQSSKAGFKTNRILVAAANNKIWIET